MKDRIKEIRKAHMMTQEEFGAALGVSRLVITTYETGRVVPDKPVRLLICEKFNINQDWLETGEGAPYKEGLIPALVHALSQMPDIRILLEQKLGKVSDQTFRKMNEALKEFLEEIK